MSRYLAKTRKVGSSIVTTPPKKLVEAQQIKENMFFETTVNELRLDKTGILKGMALFAVEDELKSSVGQISWRFS
jgi:hypothetical protein